MIYLVGNIKNKSAIKKAADYISKATSPTRTDFLFVLNCAASVLDDKQAFNCLSGLGLKILLIDNGLTNLSQYAEVDKFAGQVRQIHNNCFILSRGQIYIVDNHKMLIWGSDMCSQAPGKIVLQPPIMDMDAVLDTLEWYNNDMDYIITHEAPASLIPALLKTSNAAEYKTALAGFFDILYETVEFKKWYCSFYNCNVEVGKIVALHDQIELLDA